MFIAAVVVSIVLALALTGSAFGKISRNPQVIAGVTAVGFPEERIPLLAVPLLAGAVGLLVGLAVAPLGIAAGGGLVVYFVLTVGAHLRAGGASTAPAALAAPPGLLLVSVVALVLRITSA